MRVTILGFLMSVLLVTSLLAQSLTEKDSLLTKAKNDLRQAINNWNEADLQSARAQFERLLSQNDQKFLIHYYIGFADYNLVNFCQTKNDKKMMSKVLEDGIEHLEQSIELKNDFAESQGLLSSLLGQKIGLNPIKGIYLGPKSGMIMSKAIELDPQNPRLHYLSGVSAYFTPGMFGGGKDKAREALKKATDLFKTYKAQSNLYPDWGERDAYAWLGIIAADSDSLELANSYYEKALTIDPDFNWVKFSLKPALDEKMGKKRR